MAACQATVSAVPRSRSLVSGHSTLLRLLSTFLCASSSAKNLLGGSMALKERLVVAQGFPWRVHGLSVTDACKKAAQHHDLDVVEIFSGVGAIVAAAEAVGCRTASFDKQSDPRQDILDPTGFQNALSLVLRLRPSGLLWLAPMCNSFSWLCLKTTQRKHANANASDRARAEVQRGNLGAQASAFLLTVAWCFGVSVVFENPVGSRIWPYLSMARALVLQGVQVVCNRCAYDRTPRGERLFKRYTLFCTEPWGKALHSKCPCGKGASHRTSSRRKVEGQTIRTTGRKARLEESGRYPAAMGAAVVAAWRRAAAPSVSDSDLGLLSGEESCRESDVESCGESCGESGSDSENLLSDGSC